MIYSDDVDRDLDWHQGRVAELEEQLQLATAALAGALEMPKPGLRDYYAGQALIALATRVLDLPMPELTRNAFEIADAMLAVRERSARRAVLATAVVDAMVEREEIERSIDGEPTDVQRAELEVVGEVVVRLFANVMAEWRA